MRVQLMLTCLADAFFGEVGIATVRVLEHAGCQVEFPEAQTCCGQPPFNAGDWNSARPLADRAHRVFDPEVPVVTPSSSCAAMVRHGYETLGQKPLRAFELAEFLVQHMGIRTWPRVRGGVSHRRRIAWHSACHTRVLGTGEPAVHLLKSIPGVELTEITDAEQCCGFGGAFSANYPQVSRAVGEEKIMRLLASGADEIVTSDAGCLMHLRGLHPSLPIRHLAEVLAEVIP